MPIIRGQPTPEQIADAIAEYENRKTVRVYESGIILRPGAIGYVYLLRAENGEYKIGQSIYGGKIRRRQIESLIGMPIELLAEIPTNAVAWGEDWLQKKYANKHLHGEWFALTPEDVEWICSLNTIDMAAQETPR